MASRKLAGLPYQKIPSPSLGPLWYRPEPPCLPYPCPPPHEPRMLAPPSSLPPPLVIAPPLPPGLQFVFPVPVPPPPPSPSHHMSAWLVVVLVLLGLLLFVVASVVMVRCFLRAKRQREAAAAAADEEAMQRPADVPREFRRSEAPSIPAPKTAMQASYSLPKHPAWAPREASTIRRRAPPLTAASLRSPPPISAAAAAAPTILRHQKTTHSMPPEKVEVFKSLETWASRNVLPLLKPVDQCWQPDDFVPDSTLPTDEFTDRVAELRERTAELPDDYFVVLVGDMITEDALPTYQTMINTLDGVRDETGASPSPWAAWTRAWTAEENRHGDLLRTYLYLSGRVDMLMIERTVQYLIGAGMDPGTENNPYLGFVYTSFQERATFVSHGNTARLAKEGGDPVLASICGTIAADEKRHEKAYTRIVGKLLEVDPNGAMAAVADMMRKKITMPAHLMHDGRDPKLFEHFSAVAQRLGVYTAHDYAGILEFLIGLWGLEKLEGLTADGRRSQDFVCGLAPRIRRLQERADERARMMGPHGVRFSWIFNREIKI